ncbi:DUF397 domain-containing protein [Streptomyces sp. MST-110588]|uniref:DUF397 domain-containing protein n=1 Tax=Streptomyces sp. MST-110588 TaxID=2833628 RepID=UPI001F5D941E|nr:DUF397 domain-containing protein [Streptomyces sp. MST-110588]UNO39798.1 DUF397 domain-containing protein [Streptomyces sp. MST-110588]
MSEPVWLKSSFSEESGNSCVEVAEVTFDTPGASGTLALRESDAPDHVMISGRDALRGLLARIKQG